MLKFPTPNMQRAVPLGEVLKIVNAYRKKNSFLFLVTWAILRVPTDPPGGLSLPSFVNQVGLWDDEKHKLWGIYMGLEKEIGSMKASMCVLEIIEKKISINLAQGLSKS